MGPGYLDEALCGMIWPSDSNVVVGMDSLDDAGVYRLTDDLAIIQTVDYFTPIVDDPGAFGRIAVANALSDVYAMGGKPITAMNIVCFPSKVMDISVLRAILQGGVEKLSEAGVVLVGGHSIDDSELKYGLSVTGVVHPQRILRKAGAQPGDSLILTKALGTGIINTAIKAGVADETTIARVTKQMAALNGRASELMQEAGASACTDITGFGLLGHASEMLRNSSVGMEFQAASVPVMPQTLRFARMGLIPGGVARNRDFRAAMVEFSGQAPDWAKDVFFDPQTSGGLLISLAAGKAERLLARLRETGHEEAAIIGRVLDSLPGRIRVV